MNEIKRVRLLNSSIYESDRVVNAKYPAVVSAEINSILPHLARVTNDSMIKLTGLNMTLHWFNKSDISSVTQDSWEHVSPFDFWNKLKSSRPVGDLVGEGYL